MDSEPINVQKLLYIMRLASCLNQKLPIDFADEALFMTILMSGGVSLPTVLSAS